MDFEAERKRLIHSLRTRHEELSGRIFTAMEHVPRHLFVKENERSAAYADYPLGIGSDQTISAPHMVAIMCHLLDLRPGHRVLEVGGGCGYHAAVMAELVRPGGHVYSIERIPTLAEEARQNLLKTGYQDEVTIIIDDGSVGLPEEAPFDRISVACAAPEIPEVLVKQLSVGGMMVIPVGRYMQELYLVTRTNGVKKEPKGGVIFVPLLGKYGFR
ncbi:MAG: protein-L-isoaspartate(D-aspartate) O-methyltransferase [ANME-2 cluster archaeon]|nr:protein-L-isoaspartate(D-aspartate) O-methyltransferase [ANME-2 cluster archaeon]MCL7474441.1 protein-L-isoaspartate(D-aspartate) O-methyltransferase [ANME-2 cluster archaeon]MDF1530722.1 protein-L-isoaspartate(D-aspartate) O-methyltransferase [ANME-2 cluster archaeon]MDW7774736.1 protein-L-isoaspartate(D-aspartate) O-methyltransferase [Methanosarcinales archaeon]